MTHTKPRAKSWLIPSLPNSNPNSSRQEHRHFNTIGIRFGFSSTKRSLIGVFFALLEILQSVLKEYGINFGGTLHFSFIKMAKISTHTVQVFIGNFARFG